MQPVESSNHRFLTAVQSQHPTLQIQRAFCSDASSDSTLIALLVNANPQLRRKTVLCQHGSSAELSMLARTPLVPAVLCSYMQQFTFSVNPRRATYWGHHCGLPGLCPLLVSCSALQRPARLLTARAELQEQLQLADPRGAQFFAKHSSSSRSFIERKGFCRRSASVRAVQRTTEMMLNCFEGAASSWLGCTLSQEI